MLNYLALAIVLLEYTLYYIETRRKNIRQSFCNEYEESEPTVNNTSIAPAVSYIYNNGKTGECSN